MAELAVVRRYAHALFQTALETGEVDTVEADLRLIEVVIRENPDLRRVLGAPTISIDRKRALLETVFVGRIQPLTVRLIGVVLVRRRDFVLTEIHAEFLRLANEARGVLPVTVTSAVTLSSEEQAALSAALGQQTGKTVQLTTRVEPELLGGLVVRMGDTIIDGSIRTRLVQLRHYLASGGLG